VVIDRLEAARRLVERGHRGRRVMGISREGSAEHRNLGVVAGVETPPTSGQRKPLGKLAFNTENEKADTTIQLISRPKLRRGHITGNKIHT
jgi:hypothetical protein